MSMNAALLIGALILPLIFIIAILLTRMGSHTPDE